MSKQTLNHIRRTTICAVTALVISLPGIATAGPFDKLKAGVQKTVVHAGKIVKKANTAVNPLHNGPGLLPGTELIELVKQLNLQEQLRNTIALMQQMNADYERFSGGTFGCSGECKAFRAELKAAFDDFLLLVEDVPVLDTQPGLFENIARVADLIDYVPPRALYLMWQAMEGQMDQFRTAADNIRQLLAALPPVEEVSDIGAYANMAASYAADHPFCGWANRSDKPFIDLVQAELERLSWALTTVAGLVPDLTVEGEGGVEAGAAVANVTGSATVGFKPSDVIKTTLNVVAVIPESLNWSIKLNILRAKLVCAGAKSAAK